jgi:succinoglycan biosynthesis protein ExoM
LFIWCDEALVYETVPIERQCIRYHVKRAFVRGLTSSWSVPFLSASTVVSIAALFLYSFLLPFTLLLRFDIFVKILIKDCNHIAKLLGYAGIRLTESLPS